MVKRRRKPVWMYVVRVVREPVNNNWVVFLDNSDSKSKFSRTLKVTLTKQKAIAFARSFIKGRRR